MHDNLPSTRWTLLGWISIALFVIIYGIELLPHHGAPPTVRWIRDTIGQAGLIMLNIVLVLAFLTLLPYRRSTKSVWKSRGAFMAFVIALMTEMFGWPLFIFLISPLLDVPAISGEYRRIFGHWTASAGTALSMAGLGLVAAGWVRIHRASGLVTDGIYRYLRHPQYTGMFLFTLGWIVHWPSVATLILWPILMAAYVWLSLREERQATEEFGTPYTDYAARTKRFIPFVI